MTVSADDAEFPTARRPDRLDTLFRLLSHQRRRLVLATLERAGRTEVGDLADRVAAAEGTASVRSTPTASSLHVRTSLEHQHLPKLVHAGLVEWDRSTGEVALDDRAREVGPLMQFAARYGSSIAADNW
jgi:hypothetical protein